MGWIAERIKAEHLKHKDLEWERIAETKIESTIYYIIEEWWKEITKERIGYNDKFYNLDVEDIDKLKKVVVK